MTQRKRDPISIRTSTCSGTELLSLNTSFKKALFPIIGLMVSVPILGQTVKSELNSAKNDTLKLPYSRMALTTKFMGTAVSDTAFFSWCVSPIKDRGKYHLFVSQWPRETTMNGWKGKEAQIVHLVSDKPEGPYKNWV